MEDDDKLFSQKSFALVYVKKCKFNTCRKNGRVSSIVSRMVIQPLYWYIQIYGEENCSWFYLPKDVSLITIKTPNINTKRFSATRYLFTSENKWTVLSFSFEIFYHLCVFQHTLLCSKNTAMRIN